MLKKGTLVKIHQEICIEDELLEFVNLAKVILVDEKSYTFRSYMIKLEDRRWESHSVLFEYSLEYIEENSLKFVEIEEKGEILYDINGDMVTENTTLLLGTETFTFIKFENGLFVFKDSDSINNYYTKDMLFEDDLSIIQLN